MSLNSVMSKNVVCLSINDDLAKVKEIFDSVKFHHLLVTDEALKLVGVISDRDLLKAMSPHLDTEEEQRRYQDTMAMKVTEIMSTKLVTLHHTASLTQAIMRFNQHRISCLPIISSQREVMGILSWRDVFKYFEDKVRAQSDDE